MKYIKLFVAFFIEFYVCNFFTQPLSSLFKGISQTASINKGNTSSIVFLTPSVFSTNTTFLHYFGSNQQMSISFNMIAAIYSTDAQKTLTLSLKTSKELIGNIQIVLFLNGTAIFSNPICQLSQSDFGVNAYSKNCTIPSGQLSFLSLSQIGGSKANWKLNNTNASVSNLVFFEFNITYQFFPGINQNSNSISYVEFINLAYSVSGSGTVFINFNNDIVNLTQCPEFCLTCQSSSICSSCQPSFYIINGVCSCAGTLINYLAKDSNSFNQQLFPYYFISFSCINVDQYDQQILNTRSCQAAISSIFLTNTISLQASSSSSNSGVNVLMTGNNQSLSSIPSKCLNQTVFINSINVGNQGSSWTFNSGLSVEGSIILGQQFPVNIPNFSYCLKSDFQSFNLIAVNCMILTTFVLRDIGFNSTVGQIQNQLITVSNLNSQVQFFVPVYISNTNFTSSVNGNLSCIFCLDINCQSILSNNSILSSQIFFIKVVFFDPLVNYYNPQLFANLSINGIDVSKTINNFTIQQNQMYSAYLYSINVGGLGLPSNNIFTLNLQSTITSPSLYQSISNITFPLTINQIAVKTVPFNQSFQFFVLIFTLFQIFFFSLIGVAGFLIHIARSKNLDQNIRENDQFMKNRSNEQRAFAELGILKSFQTNQSQQNMIRPENLRTVRENDFIETTGHKQSQNN